MKLKKTLIISCSIPNATVNKEFFNILKHITKIKEKKAELKVFQTKANLKEFFYDSELYAEYLEMRPLKIADSLDILPINQRHTCMNPLTGLAVWKDCKIIPAPRIMMQSLPRQIKQKTLPRAMWTTGCINNPDGYSNTKSELKAKQLHKTNGIGALIVEVYENGLFNVRHLEFKNNEVIDFEEMKKIYKYKCIKGKVKRTLVKNVEAIVYGDTHLSHQDKTVRKNRDKVTTRIKPKKIFEHDLLDGSAQYINHHIQNRIIDRQHSSKLSVRQELNYFCKYLAKQLKKFPYSDIYLVASNHPEFYSRILQDEHRLKDIINNIYIEFIKNNKDTKLSVVLDTIEILKEMFNSVSSKKEPLRAYAIKQNKDLTKVKFLLRSDVVKVKGYLLSEHGDIGSNGSRGSFNNFKRSNPGSYIKGHTHTANRDEAGGIHVGTSEKYDVEYCNPSGYSSWCHLDAIIHENGAVQMLFYLNNDIAQNSWSV